MKLYLMRHCLTDDGPRMDAERTLDDTGREQAGTMKHFLKLACVNPDVVISSDFARAHDTAKVVNRGVDIVTTPALRPPPPGLGAGAIDNYVSGAWKAITKLAGDSKAVLVVTHGPLIEPLLASVAFSIGQIGWYHGSIAYVNTHESNFRWFVTPKLAAHLTGSEPKEVEAPLGEALLALGETMMPEALLDLGENLMRAAKATIVNPLVDQMRTALKARWARQKRRLIKTLSDLQDAITAGDAAHVTTMLQAATPLSDERFLRKYKGIRTAAYTAGANQVHAQIGHVIKEAKKKKPASPDLPPIGQVEDNGEDYEGYLDNTTADRIKTAIADISPLTYAAAVAGLSRMFDNFSSAGKDQTSRGETAALDAVSSAFHDGGSDLASYVADTTDSAVEKHWDAEDDACEICLENEDEDWIAEDETHASGDDEPPAHDNCRCSESYRVGGEEE